jgi:PilZ domain
MIFQRSIKPDRRRRKRQLLNTSVQVFTESAHMDALGINLSEVGVCLFAMVNLSVGSQIQVEFLPPRSTELVRVSGIVRHRALYLYGIEFLVDSEQPSTAELLQAVENWRPVRVEKWLDRETR